MKLDLLRPFIVLFLVAAIATRATAATGELLDIDFDGEPDQVQVETTFYRGVFDLTRNGMLQSLVYKSTETELSGANYFGVYYRPGNDWVLPCDPSTGFKPDREQRKQASRTTMTAVVERPDAQTVRVVMEGYCADLFELDWYGDIFTRRVVTLHDARRTIDFSYTVTNYSDQPRAIHVVQDHGIDCRFQDAQAFVPYPHGIVTRDNSANGSKWTNLGRRQADWWGILKGSGTGAVEIFDGAWISSAHVHAKKNAGLGLHSELLPKVLAAKESQTWSYALTGFAGLNSLHGAANGILMGLAFREHAAPGAWRPEVLEPGAPMPVIARLLSDVAVAVTIELRHLDGDTGAVCFEASLPLQLRPHEVQTASSRIPSLLAGVNVFLVTVRDGQRELVTCRESFDASGGGRKWSPNEAAPRPWQGDNVTWTIIDEAPPRPQPTPDLTVHTEHVAWARPHVKGPLKLLVAIPHNHAETHLRELYQRGDYEIVHCRDGKGLTEGLAECDAAFIAGVAINRGEDAAARSAAILAAVQRGAGVVIAGSITSDSRAGSAKRLLQTLTERGEGVTPAAVEQPYAHSVAGSLGALCFALGDGRAVIIPATIDPDTRDSLQSVLRVEPPHFADGRRVDGVNDGLFRGFEYGYQSLVGLIEWAAHRDASIVCAPMSFTGNGGDWQTVVPLENNGGVPLSGVLAVTLRNLFDETVARGRSAAVLPAATVTAVSVELGAVPSGPHVVEWRLLDPQRRVQTFGSQLVATPSNILVDIVFLREHAAFRQGDRIDATVVVREAPDGAKVQYGVVDAYGRETARGLLPLGVDGRARIEIAPFPSRTELHDLRVSLIADEHTLARQIATFYVFPEQNPMADDFYVAAWGPMSTGTASHRQIAARSARAAGVDYTHIHGDGRSNRDVVFRTLGRAYNLTSKHFDFQSFKRDQATGALTPSFVPDAERAARMKDDWQARVRAAHAVSNVFYFGMDDERSVGWDSSAGSLHEFRSWLADKYGEIAALNASWGTDYDDWAAVTGTEKIVDFGPDANLAPAFDRQAFTRFIWGHWYMRMPGQWAGEAVPGATAGEAGTYGFPYDPAYALGPWYSHTNYYPAAGYEAEVYRSVPGSGFEAGPYTGYKMAYNAGGLSPEQRALPWRTLFEGGQHVSYWELQTVSQYQFGVLQYDGLPTIGFRELARDEWPDLKGGIGKLIIDRRFVDSGVAVLHRPKHAAPTKMVIEHLGRQHHVYLEREIEAGALARDGVRVLVMSAVRAASDRLLQALDDFVHGGGHLLLVVDQQTRPGELDENGHRRSDPKFFDRLAGVDFSAVRRHVGRGELTGAETPPPPDVAGGMLRPTVAGLRLIDADPLAYVSVRGKELLGWSRRSHGQGVVHVLNATLRDYSAGRSGGVAGEAFTSKSGPARLVRSVRAIYRSVLEDARVPPLFDVQIADAPVAGNESYRFEAAGETDGSVVFGFLPGATGVAEIQLPLAGHVYDVRDRRYLGRTDHFRDELREGRAEVWAVLPDQVAAVVVAAETSAAKRGELLRVRAHVLSGAAKPCTNAHTFRIALQQRDGGDWRAVPAHDRNLTSPDGHIECFIPIALNAAPGAWRCLVRDILSGVEGECNFVVAE